MSAAWSGADEQTCERCGSDRVTHLSGLEYVCAACQHRFKRRPRLFRDMSPEEQGAQREAFQRREREHLAAWPKLSRPPRFEPLRDGIAGLNERRARSLLTKVEAALTALEDLDEAMPERDDA